MGLLTLGLALAASVGCSGGLKCVPVTGSVKVGEKAPEGVLVTLVPSGGKDDPTARPTGIVNADGTFALSTYDAANRAAVKGAPPGTYKVIFTWYPLHRPGEPSDPSAKPSVDKLGGRYADPERSTFEVTIKDEPTELGVIRLK
ncbi:hypothetical protein R5W24_004161 [Gemmata sp. JC717]|uniref:hypothetical protein n=1 Tax=Gemmata algarum TaxID=2975278 RepID=UPI0021BAC7C8|nr:hypothetical protein [Gemmata algarum]MDY3555028.1 hypothetical protein [Gemmata algarum]